MNKQINNNYNYNYYNFFLSNILLIFYYSFSSTTIEYPITGLTV